MPGFFSPLAAAPDASTHSAPPRRSSAEIDLFYLSGDYGADETTDIVYVPLILKAWGERHELSAVIPYLEIDGPPGVVGGSLGGVPTQGAPAGERRVRAGAGDIWLRGDYFALAGDGRRLPWLSLLGRLKIPTASEDEGLGTGEVDASAGISYTQPWGEAITTFLDVTRKRVGDPPGTDFQDTTGLVGGISGRLSRRLTIYLIYDREDSIVRGLPAGESLIGGLTLRSAGGWRLSASALAGLSETREDVGAMLGLGRSWEVPGRLSRRRTGG